MTATKIQPVAEICSASHDDAQFGERAIKPLCDISGFEYGTPLYAGAAPAAVAGPGWQAAADWLRNNYQDHPNIASLCDALVAAAPALEAPAAPAVPLKATLEMRAAFRLAYRGGAYRERGLWGNRVDYALDQMLAAAPQAPAAPGIDQLLDALSQHDDPCEDIADALDRVRTLRAESDRRIRAENTRVDRMAHLSAGVPTSGVLNVLRVALNRANMDYRATGFKPFEIDAAKTWVASAAPAAPAVDARDTARMNWLEAQVVNVRAPLRYGSRDLFWASPEEVDGGPDGPSDLRARIDAAQAAAKGAGDD